VEHHIGAFARVIKPLGRKSTAKVASLRRCSLCDYDIVSRRRNDMANLVAMLQKEKKVLQNRLESLEHAIKGLGGDAQLGIKKAKKMSAATKRKLSLAAKERWKKVKTTAK
jgi:hypothetical protein